jgi:hypothetical protein
MLRIGVFLAAMIAGALLAAGAVAAHDKAAHAAGKSGRVPLPVLSITKGDKCVEPTEVMRRDHMKLILHQRDETMHRGIRTTRHSLKNCIDCHADPKTNSVLGKDGFCESCHRYASVSIDCFGCHSDKPDPKTAATAPASMARALRVLATGTQP